jgi:hypothetical protein
MSPEEKEEHVGRIMKDILLVSHRVPLRHVPIEHV